MKITAVRDLRPVTAAYVVGSHMDGAPKFDLVRLALKSPVFVEYNGTRIQIVAVGDKMVDVIIDRRNAR